MNKAGIVKDIRRAMMRGVVVATCLAGMWANAGMAAEAGMIKTMTGKVAVERGSKLIQVAPGFVLDRADTITTGQDGRVGITLRDETRLTAGPNSTLVLANYDYDATTQVGKMDAYLKRGVLAVVSGKIAHNNPDAVTFRTPTLTLGVRGTEFILESNGEQ